MSVQYTPMSTDFSSPFRSKWSAQPVPTDSAGRPLAPEFNSVGDTQTGLLQSPYNLTDQLDRRGLEAMRTEALRDPAQMSRWGQMALSQAQSQNAARNAGAQTQAQNQLAMQGGLRSGARERLASQGMQQNLQSNQQALGGIQMQDELNRQKWLGMLPGQELAAAGYSTGLQDKNIGRALQEINVGRGMQQQQYNEAMRAWGADKTASAAAAANGSSSGLFSDDIPLLGGCFLTTACVDAMGLADDCWVLETARRFRDTFMTETPERSAEIVEYYKTAPKIVEKINSAPSSKRIWKRLFWGYIVPFVSEARLGSNEKAHSLYNKLIVRAKEISERVS